MTHKHRHMWRVFRGLTQSVEAICTVFVHMYQSPKYCATPSVTRMLCCTHRLLELVKNGPTNAPHADASDYTQELNARLQDLEQACRRFFELHLSKWVPEASKLVQEMVSNDAVCDEDSLANFVAKANDML
jgi:hypothetical protein